jgi:hypothetical protein
LSQHGLSASKEWLEQRLEEEYTDNQTAASETLFYKQQLTGGQSFYGGQSFFSVWLTFQFFYMFNSEQKCKR